MKDVLAVLTVHSTDVLVADWKAARQALLELCDGACHSTSDAEWCALCRSRRAGDAVIGPMRRMQTPGIYISFADHGSWMSRISGALRCAVDSHGPITKEWTGSAAKRIMGIFYQLAKEPEPGRTPESQSTAVTRGPSFREPARHEGETEASPATGPYKSRGVVGNTGERGGYPKGIALLNTKHQLPHKGHTPTYLGGSRERE